MDDSSLHLAIGSQIFGGWKSISMGRSMDAVAGSFSVSLVMSTVEAARAILPGSAVQVVVIAGEGTEIQFMDGYIDDRSLAIGSGGITLSVSGRDKTADLVDCSAAKISWTAANLLKIAKDLAAPFGLEVMDYAEALDTFEQFTGESGQTAFEIIEKAARARGVVPITDRWGNLTLVNPNSSDARAKEDLEEGKNILELSESYSLKDRFSEYTVKGQTSGGGESWDDASTTGLKATAKDTQIKRHRPLTIQADGKATSTGLKTRAAWEAQIRSGKSKEYTAKVRGWFQAEGRSSTTTPWEISRIIHLTAPTFEVDADFIISAVDFSIDGGGRTTSLTLRHPDTFKADPSGGVET